MNTPGPWYVDYDKRRDGADQVVHNHRGTTYTVAFMATGYPEEEAYANVNLIAAAPEMLEAMKAALKETGCDGDLCAHNWHEEFRRVIRKVEPDWAAR
jgi:hypothetical protein